MDRIIQLVKSGAQCDVSLDYRDEMPVKERSGEINFQKVDFPVVCHYATCRKISNSGIFHNLEIYLSLIEHNLSYGII